LVSINRHLVQLITGIAANGYFTGFAGGTIFKGKSKQLCVPGLNCYSCPGAVGTCPIGALQAVIGSVRFSFSFYIVGIISLFGVIFGRLICGWVCPFGFIQELLYKVPLTKIKLNKKIHHALKYLKYAVLLIFVILLPLLLVDEVGMSPPYFCEFICPVGTLEGGVPLVLMNESLRGVVGLLFAWKMSILILVIVLSMTVFRPFCKYLCPLGAIYGLFNYVSFYRFTVDSNKCTSCDACTRVCKMNVKVYEQPNCSECIRCGDCIKVCPAGAITAGYDLTGTDTRKSVNPAAHW